MSTHTGKQVCVSSELVITIEIGVRGMCESRVYGCLLILSNGWECQICPLQYWPFLCGVTFPCSAALSGPSYLFLYGSVVHVKLTLNVCVGYIGWKHLGRC